MSLGSGIQRVFRIHGGGGRNIPGSCRDDIMVGVTITRWNPCSCDITAIFDHVAGHIRCSVSHSLISAENRGQSKSMASSSGSHECQTDPTTHRHSKLRLLCLTFTDCRDCFNKIASAWFGLQNSDRTGTAWGVDYDRDELPVCIVRQRWLFSVSLFLF